MTAAKRSDDAASRSTVSELEDSVGDAGEEEIRIKQSPVHVIRLTRKRREGGGEEGERGLDGGEWTKKK